MEQKINELILEELSTLPISVDDGLGYLLCLHYGINPSYLPVGIFHLLKRIVVSNGGKLEWNISLFGDSFEWIKTAYLPLFEQFGIKGFDKEVDLRMRKIFSENKHLNKEKVIEATRLYIDEVDPKFIRRPHYFIFKGRGSEYVSDLLRYVDRLNEVNTIRLKMR